MKLNGKADVYIDEKFVGTTDNLEVKTEKPIFFDIYIAGKIVGTVTNLEVNVKGSLFLYVGEGFIENADEIIMQIVQKHYNQKKKVRIINEQRNINRQIST